MKVENVVNPSLVDDVLVHVEVVVLLVDVIEVVVVLVVVIVVEVVGDVGDNTAKYVIKITELDHNY